MCFSSNMSKIFENDQEKKLFSLTNSAKTNESKPKSDREPDMKMIAFNEKILIGLIYPNFVSDYSVERVIDDYYLRVLSHVECKC